MLFRTAVVLALLVGCRAADRPTAGGLIGTSDVPESTTAVFTPAPGEWPFTQWRIARAYTFNFVPAGQGHQLSLYNPATGWNESVRSRHRLGGTGNR